MSSEQIVTQGATEPETPPKSRRRMPTKWLVLIAAVIVANLIAINVVPPFPREGQPGEPCAFPVCFIDGTLEFPAPHSILTLTDAAPPAASELITFYPSISSTLFTMWVVMAIVLIGSILMVHSGKIGGKLIPGRAQNVFEWFYEFLQDFGLGIAGPAARPYIPIFVAFFLLILFSNWSGLVPPVGRLEQLRAPTSDVNVTLGLALVAFIMFEFEGFRRLGVRGYLGKFFPLYEFKNGVAAGGIALFVGLVELMLEFVKPITLSMRLFGNIYGGEVALGVITALTIAFIPVGLLGLEVMLNAIQALIFSILTLMFIVLAIESHDHEEGELAEEALGHPHGSEPALQPAH